MEPSHRIETEDLLDLELNRLTPEVALRLRGQVGEEADLQAQAALIHDLHALAQTLPADRPAEGTFQNITRAIQTRRSNTLRARIFWAAVCLAVLLFSWALVQPAVTIQMNSTFHSMQGYQIFRAESGSDAYRLIGEIPAGQAGSIAFRDLLVLPFAQYSYQIIGMDPDGQQIASPQLTVSSAAAGWTMILLALISLGVTTILYALAHSKPHLSIQSIA